METKNIIKSALSLSPAERLFIIEALSQSLSEPNSDWEKLWKDEIEQRYNALQSGEIKIIPYKGI